MKTNPTLVLKLALGIVILLLAGISALQIEDYLAKRGPR